MKLWPCCARSCPAVGPAGAFKETLRIAPLEFEKDGDSKGQLNFVEYAENVENDFNNIALLSFVPMEIYYLTLKDSNSHIKPCSDHETMQ